MPPAVYSALRWFCALTLFGLAVLLARRLLPLVRRSHGASGPPWSLLALAAVAAVAHVAAYVAIEYRIATVLRVATVLQGRYYLPGIAAQTLLVLLAWEALVPHRVRAVRALVGPALAAAMVALNWYALFGVIVPRYVGADPAAPLGIPWARLTLLAPDFNRPPLLIALFVLTLLAQAAWLVNVATSQRRNV